MLLRLQLQFFSEMLTVLQSKPILTTDLLYIRRDLYRATKESLYLTAVCCIKALIDQYDEKTIAGPANDFFMGLRENSFALDGELLS